MRPRGAFSFQLFLAILDFSGTIYELNRTFIMIYNTFVFLGKPGSGKGEQSKLLAETTGFPIVPLGKRFREIATHDTQVGRKVKDVIDNGHLMPHWFASYIFLDTVVRLEDNGGVIFDGTARKKVEAELFHEVMTWLGRPYKAIYINVPDNTALDRIQKRRTIEGRHDDSENTLKVRLEEFYNEAYPAIEYFRSTENFLEINGEQSVEDVHKDILRGIA